MPIRRVFDEQTHVVRTTIFGRVTVADLRDHFEAMHAANGHRRVELIDARGVTALGFTVRDLPALAEYGRDLFRDAVAPRAIVVGSVVHFGVARLFGSLASGWVRVCVFDDLQAAESWVHASGATIQKT
jgi:hypothetical protein